MHTLAQLISAYSLVDPEKAKVYPFAAKAFIWALLPWISVVWGIWTRSHLKKGKEHLQLGIQAKFSGADLFSNWCDYCEIPRPFCLWPPL